MIRKLVMASAVVLVLAACQQAEKSTVPAEQAAVSTVVAVAGPGDMAADFTLIDAEGVSHKLSDYRGKTVVLEWTNEGCPYVKKHYTGAMQALQRDATADGVVWLTIISSAPTTQGYVEGDEAKA